MRKIALATASRAERNLVQPIFNELRKLEETQVKWFELPDGERTAFETNWIHKTLDEIFAGSPPDVLLVPTDRVEMVPVAMVAYYMKIPVFHLFAGVGYTGTYDDLNRRVISSFSYLLLAEDLPCRLRLIRWGEESWRIKVVGTTHADNLEVDETAAPLEPFDLVLVNGNPADSQDEMRALSRVVETLRPSRLAVWVEGSTPLRPGAASWLSHGLHGYRVVHQATLPRAQFLGLMRKCEQFITNSSAAVYEAPLLKTKVVPVGFRNLTRTTQAQRLPPAAGLVADLLANFPLDPKKLLKPYGRHP